MKVIDAVWEERNLGVTCYKLSLDVQDNLRDVKKEYSRLIQKQYMVARIPSSRYDLFRFFQDDGYVLSESLIELTCDLNNFYIPDRILKICKKCTWKEMDGTDLIQLEKEISKDLFKNDKVYMDPEFKPGQSARRYNFWIKDLISTGIHPYKVMYGKETIGFFLNQKSEKGTFYGVMAGVYSGYEGSGMGYCVQYAGIQSAIDRGGKKYLGYVSGTNPSVLKILLSIGFSIKEIEYIFTKHN